MNRAALVVAAMAAALGVALLLLYKQRLERQVSGGAKVGVLMATEDVPLGTVLTNEMVALREIPESYIEDRHVLAGDVPRVIGVRVIRELRANESVLWSDLAVASSHNRTLATILSAGMRAVAVSADSRTTFGGLLRPGDRVDALLTLEDKAKGESVTIPLVQNLLVLATGDDVGAGLEPQRAERAERRTTVTIEATPHQAQVLTYAMSRGAIQVVLRNPDDVAILEAQPETTVADLVVRERRAALNRPRNKPTRAPASNEIEVLE